MLLNSIGRSRPGLWVAMLLLAGACTAGVEKILLAPPDAALRDVVSMPSTGFVISQVYGGGGNSGATLKNDFIELYNGTSADIALTGYSVQYASSNGTTWQVTPLTGTLQSGHYYLVQEAAGAGGTTNLPTPDATGGINMSATAGKVALVQSTAALSGLGCPFGANTVDFVGYGTGTSCFEGTAGPTPTLSNTTAALRQDGGRQDSNDNKADFATGAPSPRNMASPPLPPLNVLTVTISPASPTVLNGATVNFTATAARRGQPVAITSSAWTSSNTAVATIDPSSGVATTSSTGTTTIGVTATTADGTASSSTTLTVSGAPATVTVSPLTWSLKTTQTKTFTASATDANNIPVSTTFAWNSSNPAVATIDAATGLAMGKTVGSVTITATAPNDVFGTATLTVTAGNVSVQGRTDPLPVGFQTQLFINNGSSDSNGNVVDNTNVTWSSSNASVLSVTPHTGVITAKAAGSTVITATANSDGVSSGSTTIVTDVEAVSPNARIGHNTELGTPTDADPSDDVIIARRNYTLSYNVSRGGPNWVSWNLDATHTGSAARCNCFTADTALTRLGFPAYDTNDWINGGVWSRGHMSPSADWADAPGDNAPTFFLTNMLPQNQLANAGAWGNLENFLRTLATVTTEIYIVSGGIFTKDRSGAGVDGFGFMNSLGHIAVPDSVWKVAIVVPDGRSAGQITSPSDVQVIAVNMPNEATSTGTYNRFST
ncbi:MAG: DNA/RNA non-specific endonuclease, partial [Gemmatimonadota bacterium]|nr:DNA/RNA non-specific endonuclease [Gemmatimonadota bacterium]